MDIKQVLVWAVKQLKTSNYPVLDSEVILSFVLKKSREFLFAHSEKKLRKKQLEKFKKLISRRVKHEPIAYITNSKEFYGLDFYVDKNVLIPRPETELIVEEALKIISDSKHQIALIDVGTGSGCIPISIIKNLQTNSDGRLNLFATDFSRSALKIARKNARKHKVSSRIQFVYSNLLEEILRNYEKEKNKITKTIITANLPYLATEQYKKLPAGIKKYEPKSALVAGKDGLKYYRKFFEQIVGNRYICSLLLEIDPSQSKPIKKLIKQYFPKSKIEIKKDLAIRQDRLVIIKL